MKKKKSSNGCASEIGSFLVFLAVVGYILDALGVDLESQREESKYYQACQCRYQYKGKSLPLRAPDLREEKIFEKLLRLHGLRKENYQLCATNDIPEPIAGFATIKDGVRYIVYDRKYATQASEIQIVQLLGHEIGHQFLNHVANYTNSWGEEIEADEFSGWSLFKYGYGREESVNLISPNKEATEDHPSGQVQRDAVDRGWRQASDHEARKR